MTSLAALADQERRLATLEHDLLAHAAAWEWSALVGFPAGVAWHRLPDRDHGAGGNRRSASVPQPVAIHGPPRLGAE